ncbi:MAG: hypothetical protein DCF32_10045 [Leptolyngbya sp.]|nr:MAG: hypothetical protein DCF32_10045 [Leptolyngbya sp.]
MFRKFMKTQFQLAKIKDEIVEIFGPGKAYGPNELTICIQKVNEIKPFINISNEGLEDLINLVFKISLKKEESRYSSFQLYVSPYIYRYWEPTWLTCFDPPIALIDSYTRESKRANPYNVATLHRISSGIPSRPYAIYVGEEEGAIKAYGIIRIEDLKSLPDNNQNLKSFIVNKIDGMIISIDGPGWINVSLSNAISDYANSISFNLSLKHGEIDARYNDLYLAMSYFLEGAKSGIRILEEELSSEIDTYISNIWSYMLSLSANYGNGGQFILLPSGLSLGEVDQDSKNSFIEINGERVLQAKHKTSEPNLGLKIISLDRAVNSTNKYQPQSPAPFLVGKPLKHNSLSEENTSIVFDRGVKEGLAKARKIQECYQDLLDSARILSKLSTVDGCLVFNSDLQLIGFKGEVLVKEDPKCVNKLDEALELDGEFDISEYGTRHRSAARFCGKVPNAVVFVVSQDGDIRVFNNMNNGEVGVAGPFHSWPGSSPNIENS